MRVNYLAGQEITGNMRAILVDWLVQVQMKFRLLQETMYMTVAIIDRFLQVRKTIKKLMPNLNKLNNEKSPLNFSLSNVASLKSRDEC